MTKRRVKEIVLALTVAFVALAVSVFWMAPTASAGTLMYDGVGGEFTGSGPNQTARFNSPEDPLNGWGKISGYVVDEDLDEQLHVQAYQLQFVSIVVGDQAYQTAARHARSIDDFEAPQPGPDEHGVLMVLKLTNPADQFVSLNYMEPVIGSSGTDWYWISKDYGAYVTEGKTRTFYLYANVPDSSEMLPMVSIMNNKGGDDTNANNYVYINFPVDVPTGPEITKQPKNASAAAGATARFSIEATGEGTLTYRWQSKQNSESTWADSSQNGANTPNLSVTANTGLDGWLFRCIVKDENGKEAISETVTLSLEKSILSAKAKYSTIERNAVQEFTVVTTSDVEYLMLYAEGGSPLVQTWAANGSIAAASDGKRIWNVSKAIGTPGDRKLVFKGGTTKATPVTNAVTAAFKVEYTGVISASAKYAAIGKGGTQTFTVKTTANAQNLMLYAEGGNQVKTWPASGNSTVSGDVRTWNVKLAIASAGNRVLTFKAAKSTTPTQYTKSVKFTVVSGDKKIVSAIPKYSAITKASVQGFTVTTTTDVKYLMMYAEGGNLVKSWAASGNSTVADNNIRTWYVMQPIGTAGDRRLIFKGGIKGTTAETNAATASFKVVNTGVLTASAKNATIKKGTAQTFTVTTTADCKYLAVYAEGGNLVNAWTANSSNSKVSGNVRTWTVSQVINSAGKRTLTFKAGPSAFTAAERNAAFTVQ